MATVRDAHRPSRRCYLPSGASKSISSVDNNSMIALSVTTSCHHIPQACHADQNESRCLFREFPDGIRRRIIRKGQVWLLHQSPPSGLFPVNLPDASRPDRIFHRRRLCHPATKQMLPYCSAFVPAHRSRPDQRAVLGHAPN